MRIAIAGSTGLIGKKLVTLAEQQGHEVVALSRRTGFDLTDAGVHDKLVAALDGVDAVVDVTQGANFEEDAAVAFYRSVATTLGRAATQAGVARTVVLSIVGVDRSPDYGYYVAKVAQEAAHREASPGVVVLRATQFHEFVGQNIDWYTDGGVATVMDVKFQPVEAAQVVAALLGLATETSAPDAGAHDIQLAGPAQEYLVELCELYVRRRGLDVRVAPEAAPASMADGGMLPQDSDDVVVRGVDWRTWFDEAYPEQG